MKAYMSGTHRERAFAALDLPGVAVREAERILADVEPSQAFTNPGDECLHFSNPYTAHLEACILCTDAEHGWPAQYKTDAEYATQAMIESLARFVGES